MKFGKWMCLTPLTLLVALAISHGLAAQDSAMQNQKAKHHMYRLVDVGTLGGPLSQFASSTPLTVNSGGIGTAIADTSIPDPYSPNCLGPDCMVAQAARVAQRNTNGLGYSSWCEHQFPSGSTIWDG
jgi:hypothetical protein